MSNIPVRADKRTLNVGINEIRFALDQRGLLPPGAWGKDEFMAQCPSHEDRDPSLKVSIGDHASVVFHCHAGCSYEEILRELDIWRELKGTRESLESPLESYVDVGGGWRDPLDVLERRARALGIDEDLDEPFACVLPGHRDLARIVSGDGRPARYRCGADRLEGSYVPDLRLAVVFRWRLTGALRLLYGPLACRWFERLEFEAGLLVPTRIAVPIPISASWATRRVADRLALFLGLRDATAGGYDLERPFTFAKSFRADYCGVSEKQARDAMRALERAGSIRRVGTVLCGGHEAIKWALGGAA